MWILLAVLLAVGQASTPIPRKAPDNPTNTGPTTEKKATPDKAPPAPALSKQEVVVPKIDQQPSRQISKQNAQEPIRIGELPTVSVEPDWTDYANPILTLILVVITGIQAVLLKRTLNVVKDQTEATKTAANAARDNVQAARDNAKAAEANAEAARDNAKAVRESIEVMVNKERARIRIVPKELGLPTLKDPLATKDIGQLSLILM